MSFNVQALAIMAQRHPEIARGLNMATAPSGDSIALSKIDFLSINNSLSDNPDIQLWRSSGQRVLAWTVRSADQQANLDGQVDNYMFEGFTP